jgi:hypothetical protein
MIEFLKHSAQKRRQYPEQPHAVAGIIFWLDTLHRGVLQQVERYLRSKADIQTFNVKLGGRLN